jgi:hypothetical protein
MKINRETESTFIAELNELELKIFVGLLAFVRMEETGAGEAVYDMLEACEGALELNDDELDDQIFSKVFSYEVDGGHHGLDVSGFDVQ